MKKIIMLIVLTVSIAGLFAQLMYDEAIAVRQGTNIEWFRSSTSIPEGVVYVWSDTRHGGRDLYAQLISPTGQKLWGENGLVVDNKPDRQEDPMIITASDGNVIIAYIDFSIDPDGDILAQKITPAGEKLWGTEGIIVCNANGIQISINMVPDNQGGAYIAWSDKRVSTEQIYVQHVNSAGAVSWTTNGINADPSAVNKGSNTFWEDNEGGAVMAYNTIPSGTRNINIIRFDINGIAWGPLPMANNPGEETNAKMCPDGDNGFIFAWEYKDPDVNDLPRLRVQRINLQGEFLWGPNGVNVTPTVTHNQERHRIVEVTNGGAIIAWEDKRNPGHQDPDIYYQKFDLQGNRVWAEGGVPLYLTENLKQINLRMSKTNDNGAVIVWEDARNYGDDQKQVFAQKINADGTKAWTPEGKIICSTIGGQEGANVKLIGDNYAFVWADSRTGSLALMTQLVSATGEDLYQTNGIEIFYGLSGNAAMVGDTPAFVTRAWGDNTYIVWLDTRHGVFGAKMYYQIIDGNGNEVMPHNGARVSTYTEPVIMPESVLTTEINENGEMLIVWNRDQSGLLSFYAQIINAQGEKLLGDVGLELRQNGNTAEHSIIKWRNNGWEIYWSENYLGYRSVFGQRIENNALAWGNSGRLIANDYDEIMSMGNSLTVFAFSGDYILFSRLNHYNILKLNADGTPASGWPALGKQVTNRNTLMSNIHMFEINNKIIVLWAENYTQFNLFSCIYASVLNLDGTPAYDNHVINLTPFEDDQSNLRAYIKGSEIFLTYLDFSTGHFQTTLQKIRVTDNGIEKLWGENGVNAINQNNYDHAGANSLPMWERNLVVWSMNGENDDDEDIFMAMQNPDGSMSGSATGLLVNNNDKNQQYPRLAKNSNSLASVVWVDGLSSGKEPIYGLYLQRVNTGAFTSENDITNNNTPSFIQSAGNYPNPFNPETNIVFNIKQAAHVNIEIFNVKGQKVRTLANDYFEGGLNSVTWNGQNDNGKNVGSGLYFYKIQSNKDSVTQKMLLLK